MNKSLKTQDVRRAIMRLAKHVLATESVKVKPAPKFHINQMLSKLKNSIKCDVCGWYGLKTKECCGDRQ